MHGIPFGFCVVPRHQWTVDASERTSERARTNENHFVSRSRMIFSLVHKSDQPNVYNFISFHVCDYGVCVRVCVSVLALVWEFAGLVGAVLLNFFLSNFDIFSLLASSYALFFFSLSSSSHTRVFSSHSSVINAHRRSVCLTFQSHYYYLYTRWFLFLLIYSTCKLMVDRTPHIYTYSPAPSPQWYHIAKCQLSKFRNNERALPNTLDQVHPFEQIISFYYYLYPPSTHAHTS